MSSTRERPDRGQALAVFALSLTTVLLAAALAFDAGIMFVERRTEQNAADAAAIAGARYLTEVSVTAKGDAESAARGIATDNGFTHGDGAIQVDVHIPPIHGVHQGLSGYIEVEIANQRPSVFAAVMGVLNWDVSARAVARNSQGSANDFTILALDENRCNAFKVTGSGNVYSRGDLQVNSECPSGALVAGGGGTIEISNLDAMGGACNVVGPEPNSIVENGGGSITCVKNPGAMRMGDPLVDLRAPARPTLPATAELIDGDPGKKGIPDGCPGADKNVATWDSPRECAFQNAAYVGTTWRLHPGLYPGGLDLSTGTFYLTPGIYYIAGGGFSAGGKDATVVTVGESGLPELDGSAGRGVMIYNTDHPSVAWKPLSLNGGYADFEMLPFQLSEGDPDAIYNNIIIFNDRDFPVYDLLDTSVAVPKSVTLNGGGSNFDVRGVVYSPRGQVYVNGNSNVDGEGSPLEFTLDKVIAGTYTLNGNGGSIMALNDGDFDHESHFVGLIE